MKTAILYLGAILLLVTGCTKYKLGPSPFGFKALVQHPFQSYLDSILAFNLNTDSLLVTQQAINLNDPNTVKEQGTGQAEVAFAFRTSSAGIINQLGVYLPTPGFSHTVTLWDSTTGAVLAQENVATPAAGGWAYTGLLILNSGVIVQANHGYIIGFNSVAVGVPINTDTVANEMYLFNGIYDFKSNPPPGGIPMIPFTWKSVTVEGWYQIDYDTPISAPIFPGAKGANNYFVIAFLGACDIGFIPD